MKGPIARASSPRPGNSTLMTRAPRSANTIVQYGPARTRVRSTTSTPESGPAAVTSLAIVRLSDLLRFESIFHSAQLVEKFLGEAITELRVVFVDQREFREPSIDIHPQQFVHVIL